MAQKWQVWQKVLTEFINANLTNIWLGEANLANDLISQISEISISPAGS